MSSRSQGLHHLSQIQYKDEQSIAVDGAREPVGF